MRVEIVCFHLEVLRINFLFFFVLGVSPLYNFAIDFRGKPESTQIDLILNEINMESPKHTDIHSSLSLCSLLLIVFTVVVDAKIMTRVSIQ